ncbi:hypothetical protein [Geodermatophilus sp. SYSU D00815]
MTQTPPRPRRGTPPVNEQLMELWAFALDRRQFTKQEAIDEMPYLEHTFEDRYRDLKIGDGPLVLDCELGFGVYEVLDPNENAERLNEINMSQQKTLLTRDVTRCAVGRRKYRNLRDAVQTDDARQLTYDAAEEWEDLRARIRDRIRIVRRIGRRLGYADGELDKLVAAAWDEYYMEVEAP